MENARNEYYKYLRNKILISEESFYGAFKAEFIHRHRFSTDEELNKEVVEYVCVL